ncbi:MAG: TIGR00341 family protein [Brumimicrobium sp.]|nr:TIGR00341 family protein [Brumimicrobium sp.]
MTTEKENNEHEKEKAFGDAIEGDPTKVKINPNINQNVKSILNFIKETLSFKEGANIEGTIKNIKEGIDFKGPNVWVLICSIIVASVGLNMNSAAVIIGAMLISPLMGPIRGVGLGVGTNDISLIIDSLKNFGVAVGISILTAWLYFLISPIDEFTYEIEARTSPNLMDVFVAFFGGLAGIVAASRGDNSTVIPGVAIATALMPPLCTAGYGLAMGQINLFFGASYLFLLNSLFICLSTILVVRYLKFPLRQFIDKKVEKKVAWTSYILLFLVVAPAIFLFYTKVKETVFRENAKRFAQQVILSDEELRAEFAYEYKGDSSLVEVYLKNKIVSEEVIDTWERQMPNFNLSSHYLRIIQGEDLNEKIESLRENLNTPARDISYSLIRDKQDKIDLLEQKLTLTSKELEESRRNILNVESIRKNIDLHFPEIDTFEIYSGYRATAEKQTDTLFAIAVKYKDEVALDKKEKLNRKLKKQIKIQIESQEIEQKRQVKVYNY